ncbi:MAG: M1 family metallopeptidase [Caldilineaceae bacterium]
MNFSILSKLDFNALRPYWRYILVAVLLLIVSLFLVRACRVSQENQDVFGRYRPALKVAFQKDLETVIQAPRYALDVQLDPKADNLFGKAVIHIVNTSPDPWPYLIFRLYPMLGHYHGKMVLQSVAVGDQPVPYVYQAENTAMRMNLLEPLAPHASIDVHLVWRVEIPTWSDATDMYALFGKSQQMVSLPLFYPSLAVYQAGPTPATGHWWLEEGSARGDAALNVASLFVVTATMPSDQVPVASGTLITSTLIGKNQARHVWVTGPAREFLLHLSTQFRSATTDAYGTHVTSYWLPGQDAAGQAVLDYAVAALRIYSDRYGPYPYSDLRFAPAALAYHGMEYPQASLLGDELYTDFREELEPMVAHEVAHQWWYQIVGSDPVNEPWLDEALAEYSVKLYMEAMHGQVAADKLQHERWETPFTALKNAQADRALNEPVKRFGSSKQYETVIYAKGALLYDSIRKILGDRQFTRFLQSYLANHRYQIVDTNDWRATLRTLNNPQLDELYQNWVLPALNGASPRNQ